MRDKEWIVDHQGYEDLANAIVVVAARDYRLACRSSRFGSKKALERIEEIEKFFNSKWGDLLCHGKAKDILLRLQAEQGAIEAVERVKKKDKAERSEWQCLTCKYYTFCIREKQAYYKITGEKCNDYKERKI